MRHLKYLIIAGGIISAILIFILLSTSQTKLSKAGEEISFILTSQATARSVAYHLKEKGVIDNPTKFILLAKLFNYERKLRKGKYRLAQGIDELQALKILAKGGEWKTLITIPEGKTLNQIAEILEREGVCPKNDFINQASDPNFLKTLGIQEKNAEGYLFPDSYEFELPSDPKEVLVRMTKRFFSVFNQVKVEAKSSLPDHEVVILASMVEAEAGVDSERPIIASVFLNRLRRRLPLQSCATIEYVLEERKPRLSYEDLNIPSPYNTYLHIGLPPGPICNPGQNSLSAVLFPAQSKYLYFVSRGDGTHQFSQTNREHQAAIRRYKK
ncbi:MAG: endolytic transglycosylase MltG [candidate division WOR-3 bacterium]|nr:endolytic transglycosylase MltG [candidate division WOR-3 bacterium]